jgi:PTH1 family peptidyl-tRNA hydrolase
MLKRRRPKKADPGGILVVGLRNPGSRYAGTRHNVGAMAVVALADRQGADFSKAPKSIPADVADVRLADGRHRLALPRTFMNDSGRAVQPLTAYFKPETLLLVHDDIDLGFGVIRIHHGRGSGGHNGVRDVARALGGNDFWRVRIGIGRPPARIDPADYVLQQFSPAEADEAAVLVQESADVIAAFIAGGEEAARQMAGNRPGDWR